MNKSIKLAVILVLLALLTACGSAATATPVAEATAVSTETTAPTPASNSQTRLYTDAFGREVELPANPQRIVAHYYASDMVALGLPMIGTNYPNAEVVLSPEQLQNYTDTGGGDPNIETILSLKPDLIFVPDFTEAATVNLLAEIAPTVVIPYDGDPFERLRLFGDLVGKPEVAEAWISAYNAKAAAKREEVASFIAEGETATAFIMYSDGQLYLYGRPRFGPTMYDVFGFAQPSNVAELFKDNPEELWQTISLELLPQYAGDRIFLAQANDEDSKTHTEKMINNPLWKSLPAVQNNKVYYVDSRWGLNDPLTLDWLLDEMAKVLDEKKAGEAEAPVTATDMLGRTVSLPKPAQRVVTLYSEPYAQILALEMIPVGSFGWPGQPLEAAYAPSGLTVDPSVKQISGTDYLPDWELIAALKPDLVIGWGTDEAQTAEGIVPFFGMETYSDTKGDTIADYEKSLRALATLTGRETEAEAAITAMRDRVAAYEKQAPKNLKVLHLGTSDGQTFFAFNGASINCGMIDKIADCAIEDLGTGRYADLTLEGVLAIDPDVILFTGPIFDGPETIAAARAATEAQVLWPELRAVKNGRVHFLPIDTRPDSVLTIGMYFDIIAPLLYPDVFPQALTNEQVQEILAKK